MTENDGNIDCKNRANWWRCDCGKANWNTITCRDCGYNKVWHGWGES